MAELFLVYRSHYAGPLSKSIHRLEADSLLGWFQQLWLKCLAASSEDEARDIVDAEVGVQIYGFCSIGAAVVEHQLEPPQTIDDLRRLLHKHLYVEGGPESIQVTERTLRCATDDDEVELAYYFFDATYAQRHPEQVAYLLHEDWRLPTTASERADFTNPGDAKPLLPAGDGPGVTYAALLTFYDSETIGGQHLYQFPGVRLPNLTQHLLTHQPDFETVSYRPGHTTRRSWPLELRLLRGLIEPTDADLSAALARVPRAPLQHMGGAMLHSGLGLGPHAEAAAELAAIAHNGGNPLRSSDTPEKSLIAVSEHLAQLCHHATAWAGYQQWFLFDDLWATANPDLAASLLRYADRWDPLSD